MTLQLPAQIHVKEVLEFDCCPHGCSHWIPPPVLEKAVALKWHNKRTMQAPFAKILMTNRDAAEWFRKEYDLNSL